jgi:D-aspartate ligase
MLDFKHKTIGHDRKPGAIIIEGHVQGLAITRSLGENGIPVVVVETKSGLARHSRYCFNAFRCPDYLGSDFAEFLIDLCNREKLHNWTLYPTNDHAVYTISRNWDQLSKHYKIISPSFETYKKTYNKRKSIEICHNIGVETPATFFPEKYPIKNIKLKFPVIIKGIEGLSFYKMIGSKSLEAYNIKELDEKINNIKKRIGLDDIMVQEIIPYNEKNKVVSFTSFCENGEMKCIWIGNKVREHPHRFGTATFCESTYKPEIIEPASKILQELKYTGVSEIEFLKDPRDGKYKFIEMNARTWLWVSLARRCGIDFPLIIYNYLNSITNNFSEDYPENIKWVHIWTDLFFSVTGIIKKKYKMPETLKSLSGKKEFAVFSLKDIKPFIFETIKLPYIALNR